MLEASKATKRAIAVFATALTCMTVSTRKNSTYLYMIGMFKRRHQNLSRLLNDDGVETFQLEVGYGKKELQK